MLEADFLAMMVLESPCDPDFFERGAAENIKFYIQNKWLAYTRLSNVSCMYSG